MRKDQQRITLTCEKCGGSYSKQLRSIDPMESLCRKCKLLKTKKDVYGSIDNYNEQMNATKRQTCIEKYGVGSFTETQAFKDKAARTIKERYGVDNPQQDPGIKEKTRKTKIGRYGSPFYNMTKARETCISKYGVPSFAHTEAFARLLKSRYSYDGKSFDSSWELAYYIYLVDNRVPFTYKPQGLPYSDDLGKAHVYHPDFYVDGRYIEIKGNHLRAADGTVYSPYKNDRQKAINQTLLCKQKCMDQNDVLVLSKQEILPILRYIEKAYGLDYLKSYRQVKGAQCQE